jgi:formamidopyrimidine-DNA glycosylase
VYFRDTRKFGKVLWPPAVRRIPGSRRLGIDAAEDRGATCSRQRRGRRVAIKSLLLDQSVLAGVGQHLRGRGAVPRGRAADAQRARA